MYQHVDDNFDFMRYSYDGIDRSNIVNPIQNAKYFQFVLDNINSFYLAYLQLYDRDSRDIFKRLLRYRCLGHSHIRIREDKTWSSSKAMLDRATSYVGGLSEINYSGLFGGLMHHVNVPINGNLMSVDAWSINVAYCLGVGSHRQYYFQRDNIRIAPELGDGVIDGGACFGDTSLLFSSSVGDTGRVYAFEPLPLHQKVIEYNIFQNELENVIYLIPAGVGDVTNNVDKVSEGLEEVASPGFSMLGVEANVPVLSIDDLARNQGVKSIDFIKLDIEGYELKALKGAEECINKFRPKMAISLYHKPEDFFEIPLYLKEKHPFYKFYLDHYTNFSEETVLYAISG